MARIVLLTGVSGYLGAEVTGALRDEPGIERLIEVTSPGTRADGLADRLPAPPPDQPGPDRPGHPDEEVVRLDVRTGQIGDLIRATGADTVVHMGIETTPARAGGRASMKETNVIGALQLLSACQRSETVRKVVVRSSTAVYGTSARNPAVFTEDMEPRASYGYARDVLDVEGYVRGLARRRPDIAVSVLRFVNFLGPGVDSPLTRYFTMPVSPTVLGYDPRIQFVDISDGVEVIRRMVTETHRGIYNVTGRGAMLISQCLRRAGRVPVPVPAPALSLLAEVGGRLFDVSPDQRDLLRYGRVVDGAKLEHELNWVPCYSTQEAFDSFVADRVLPVSPVVGAIDRLMAALPGAMPGLRK